MAIATEKAPEQILNFMSILVGSLRGASKRGPPSRHLGLIVRVRVRASLFHPERWSLRGHAPLVLRSELPFHVHRVPGTSGVGFPKDVFDGGERLHELAHLDRVEHGTAT